MCLYVNSLIVSTCFIGERTEQQQLQGVHQILDTEPYLYQNRGQTRHSRGPVQDSSVLYIGKARAYW